jgi:putative component of toxin-antitoxin plasmid stabilization module
MDQYIGTFKHFRVVRVQAGNFDDLQLVGRGRGKGGSKFLRIASGSGEHVKKFDI